MIIVRRMMTMMIEMIFMMTMMFMTMMMMMMMMMMMTMMMMMMMMMVGQLDNQKKLRSRASSRVSCACYAWPAQGPKEDGAKQAGKESCGGEQPGT